MENIEALRRHIQGVTKKFLATAREAQFNGRDVVMPEYLKTAEATVIANRKNMSIAAPLLTLT